MTIHTVRAILLLLMAALLSGCAATQFDRAGAKNLATAGQLATSALQQQAAQVSASLTLLPITISVKEILDCRGVKEPVARDACIKNAPNAAAALDPQRMTLIDILEKRQTALQALSGAYTAFGDLAADDAGEQAAAAMDHAFAKTNTLIKAVAPILPAGVVMAPITASMSTVIGGLGALAADQRQAQLILPASTDLRAALDAMIAVLKREEDSAAMTSLMAELQDTVNRMERSTLDAGLGSSMSVLASFYSKVATDISLASSAPAASTDLATAAAKQVLMQTMSSRKKERDAAYGQAIAALLAVRAQHRQFETKQPVDLSLAVIEAQRLREMTKNIGK